MKPLREGMSAELDVIVSPEMTVRFDELGPGHPVYATYWLAKHMEEASRKLLLPRLEDGGGGDRPPRRNQAPELCARGDACDRVIDV